MKRLTPYLLKIVLASLAGTHAFATPIDFDFSFHDYFNGGDITGYILGLDDNGTGQAATSLFVTSNTAGYGVGEYVAGHTGDPINYWNVVDGSIKVINFYSEGQTNTAPGVVCCTLWIDTYHYNKPVGGLRNRPYSSMINGHSVITFIPRAVPIPQTFALLMAGLAALGISRRRQKLPA